MCKKIDFVIPWVDGSDPKWIEIHNNYCESNELIDDRKCNYRDFGLLKYWFRGVEKFAPWVNRIFFITNGQKPEWLNINNEKLRFVNHTDYIPKDCLPTFNANAIEIGLHEIDDLSEYFVYFNDDFYLIDSVTEEFFFKKGLPRDEFVLTPLVGDFNSLISYYQLTNCSIINDKFEKKFFLKKYFFKYFNLKYGLNILRNFLLLPFPYISSFYNGHFAQPFLKSTIGEVWNEYGNICEQTRRSRFRSTHNVNQYVFRYWQLMKGKFYPTSLYKKRKYFTLGNSFNEMCEAIRIQKYKEIVINDGGYEMSSIEYEKLNNAFASILPDKSSFEV